MAKAKAVRFQLRCTKCKSINYNSSNNPAENKDKLELNKHCLVCRAHSPHAQIKMSKPKK